MGEQSDRSYRLTVEIEGYEGVKIDTSVQNPPLDITFDIVRTTRKEPNTADIKVYNLNPENRSNLESAGKAIVVLEAGYGDDNGIIFRGDAEINNHHNTKSKTPKWDEYYRNKSQQDDLDWITSFEANDGGKAVKFDRINKSFAAGTTIKTVITEIAKSLRVNIGNSVDAALKGELIGGGKEFLNSITVSGNAAKALTRLTRSSGLEWSIQNGTLQLTKRGEPATVTAVYLSAESGLIGSPSIGNERAISFISLMNKDIYPGALVSLSSKTVVGEFRAERCNYIGQSFGNNWYVETEAIPV